MDTIDFFSYNGKYIIVANSNTIAFFVLYLYYMKKPI
jgi:hypothetical protein